MLVSAVQWSESALSIHISPASWASLLTPPSLLSRSPQSTELSSTYRGILLSHKKECSWVIWKDIDAPRVCHTEWRKPLTLKNQVKTLKICRKIQEKILLPKLGRRKSKFANHKVKDWYFMVFDYFKIKNFYSSEIP